MVRLPLRVAVLTTAVVLFSGPCAVLTSAQGQSPGQAARPAPHASAPTNVVVPRGYQMFSIATGLDFPTAIAFSSTKIWVSEAGFLPGLSPKVKQLNVSGGATTILSGTDLPAGTLEGPLTDVTYHDGLLWITHRQVGVNGWLVGAISKFDPSDPVATFTTVITNLPSAGDHYTEEIVFDASGRAYFSQGSATNSSVVGPDNQLVTGWLEQFPTFHDYPALDVVLNGTSYRTPVPFSLDPTASRITAPFMPFGSGPAAPGTVVHGASPATPQDGIVAGNGTVYSFDPNASDPTSTLRLEAWGFRNPYGIGLDPFHAGTLFVSNNGADTREATIDGQLTVVEPRPIQEDYDDLFTLRVGGTAEFFGWPDLFHDEETGEVKPVTDEDFCHGEGELPIPCPGFVLDDAFRNSLATQSAFGQPEYHSSANKFDFARSHAFGFLGDVFLAETGSFVPVTGAPELVGYRVVRFDRSGTGDIEGEDFIVHTDDTAETIFDPAGFNKPIDVKFFDRFMLIVDFGVFEPGLNLSQPGTGKVWVVGHGRGRLVPPGH
jgi:hypothetical protein